MWLTIRNYGREATILSMPGLHVDGTGQTNRSGSDAFARARNSRFRDRLRSNPTLAQEYTTLKRALAERYRNDREAYTEAKAAFIERWSEPAVPG
jgi:GrpB-like predicted nucleotidyltransferase (UPF0157 family)